MPATPKPRPTPRPDASTEELLRGIAASLAAGDARFDELFRGLGQAQADAREARDSAREVSLILREQNALAKIEELRAEARGLVAALREDVVLAQANERKARADLDKKVGDLEKLRDQGTGALKGARLAWDLARLLGAGGIGAGLIKALELLHH